MDSIDSHDFLVSFYLVGKDIISKDLLERGTVRIPLTSGDFGNVSVFFEMIYETVDEFIIAKNGLSLNLRPERFFPDSPSDELTIFLLRLDHLSAELSEYPICGKAGMGF